MVAMGHHTAVTSRYVSLLSSRSKGRMFQPIRRTFLSRKELVATRKRDFLRSAETSTPELRQEGPSQNVMEAPEIEEGSSVGNVQKCCAHWVRRDVIVWRIPATGDSGNPRSFYLNASANGGARIARSRSFDVDWSCELVVLDQALQFEYLANFPHLIGCTLLRVPESALEHIHKLMKYQVVISCQQGGVAIDATGVQHSGALDDLYSYDGPLGPHLSKENDLAVSVWAPTAFRVELLHWESPTGGEMTTTPMEQAEKGVWTLKCPNDWMWQFYKFRVTALSPFTQRVETMEVTDPYSRGLAANGERSQFVDMSSSRVKPADWDAHDIPKVQGFSDITVYELHVRDFSVTDDSVPSDHRGKYLAFRPKGGEQLSNGLKHLKKLREAGMTHVHLLPSYDFASVPERVSEQRVPQGDLSEYPPDSEEQQRIISEIADSDGFNWGYDPVHYGVPEGSYATDPDGPARILEFREMVQGLHELGFKVVLDVVYNHTYECGPHSRFSVLDKVVPGYYHRREENGDLCSSACGANTASEHAMFERLVVDDLVHWAKQYKVDGFRFDIMGHLMLSTTIKAQEALNALTVDVDGVDGKSVYLYGEGWDFGEVQHNRRGRNTCQLNIEGFGWGTFNDRFRDGVLGGSPMEPPTRQGFLTGLFLESNDKNEDAGTSAEQKEHLLKLTDNIRLGLAGNLSHYEMEDSSGEVLKGKDFPYHNQPTGYCAHPWENVPFVGCHDNATQFDLINIKASSEADVVDRAKMSEMAIALVMLSQGVPFLHAGDEFLRSKSLDVDSYNSGDWFNRIDWTYQSSNFGVGLPPASKNQHLWPLYRTLLGDRSLVPSPDLMEETMERVLTFLRIRYSSPLFRIPSAEDICKQLTFHNTGEKQIPGVIVMEISSSWSKKEGCFDEVYKRIVVAFNASPSSETVPFRGDGLELHPYLKESGTSEVYAECQAKKKNLTVPARTSCVWVQRR
ncbi:hypothetical protein BSKO_01306 [Bryopsis sp. KO-2023]|nr:hypothetical protein BSKO_01306 [Bryopsis sp. KO-2023]